MAPPHDGTRKHPGWLLKIIEAKQRAFDALSDAEKVAALDVQKERRQRVRAKRAASLSLATQIFKLHDAGHTATEIAAIVGRRPVSVIQFAASRGVFISRGALIARRAVILTREREDALRRMASDYGTAAAKALDDLLTFSLDDDAAVARRILHARRTPDASPYPLARGGAPAARRRADAGRDRQDVEPAAVDGPMGSGRA